MKKSKNPSVSNYIITWLIAIPASLIYLIIFPLIVFFSLKENIFLRRFRKRNAGCVYLICTRKKGWYNFLNNNVIPVLPDNFKTVWLHAERESKIEYILKCVGSTKMFCIEKPYMVIVRKDCFDIISLNKVFQGIKQIQKKDKKAQSKALKIINDNVKSSFNESIVQ